MQFAGYQSRMVHYRVLRLEATTENLPSFLDSGPAEVLLLRIRCPRKQMAPDDFRQGIPTLNFQACIFHCHLQHLDKLLDN